MSDQTRHPLQPYWDVAKASVQADALAAALNLGIFDALGDPATANEVAKSLGLDAGNTGHLLALLWSMALLQRTAPGASSDRAKIYCLTPLARRYLHRASSVYCGDAWAYRLRSLRHFGTQLHEHLLHGAAAPYLAAVGKNWAAAARGQIGQEQRAITVDAALTVLERLPVGTKLDRVLDLGGGPGWVAIALAQSRPALHGVVFDWPETAEVAKQNIADAGLAMRLWAQGGDLITDTIGQDYDLIWCSSVLHFVPDVGAVLRKIHSALRPGGIFVCAQAEISRSATHAADVLPYYLPMMMMGRAVTEEGGLALAMTEAGFVNLASVAATDFPMAPVQVQIARREQP